MIPFVLILPISAMLITLFLGFLVFANNPRSSVNRVFLLLTFIFALWIFTVFMADLSKDLKVAIFWTKLAIVWPAFVPPICLYFSFIFPREKVKISSGKIFFLFLPVLIFLVLAPTKFNVKEVFVKSWGVDFIPGVLYYVIFIYFLIYFFYVFRNFLKSYRIVSYIEKIQILYIVFGLFVGIVIGFIANWFFPIFLDYGKLSILGPFFSIISFVGFTTYAILKHHLMNIKIIATEILVFIVFTILTIEAFSSTSILAMTLKLTLAIIFGLIGYFLIKSVIKEIKMREDMEKLAFDLEKANVELNRLSKAKSEFISIASHQLRTPLTAIKGYVSMILEGSYGKMPEKAKSRLENVFTSNERLIDLVNNLLSISRIESGKIKLEPEKTSIEEIIDGVIFDLKINAEKKKLSLKFEKSKKPIPEMFLDKDKMRQVILNLIDNAIKYTQKGSIVVILEAINKKLQIKVVDTGGGMEKEELSKLFQSFSRGTVGTKTHTEGSGLGLYIARLFVEMHNGRIWAESQGKGNGSTFYVELPIKE